MITKKHAYTTSRRLVTSFLAVGFLLGCGGGEPEAQSPDTSASGEDITEETQTTQPTEPNTDDAMEDTTPTPSLLLRDLNPDEPIPVADLQTAYFAWGEQPVVIGGYLDVPTRRGRINRRISLTSEPGGEVSMAGCTIENPSGERVQSDEPIVVKGILSRYSGKPKLELEDCEVVSIGEAFDESTPATPGLEKPIPVAALYEAVTDWYGKEVSVVGYYRGNTHSSANDKTSVALASGAGMQGVVNCNMPGEGVVPESVAANREGVIMRGSIGESTWTQVVIENCSFENRE